MTEAKVQKILDVKFYARDLTPPREVTLREWLADLLMQVWKENEGFSGKRPWGNSGWDWDPAPALIRAGFVAGELDEDEYIETLDEEEYDKVMRACIRRMAKP